MFDNFHLKLKPLQGLMGLGGGVASRSTGAVIVPPLTSLRIKAWGAAGAASYNCGYYAPADNGAGGGFVDITYTVGSFTRGDVLRIMVGQAGVRDQQSQPYGGGGSAGGSGGSSGGGGTFIGFNPGGSNPNPITAPNMILAAGGGAGGSTGTGGPGQPGNNGGGGGPTGANGAGSGGTQSAGGAAGTGGFGGGGSAGTAGSFMNGGTGMSCKGSGGGSGYYGGGGGNGDCGACSSGAAGGGSSYVGHPTVNTVNSNVQAWGSNQNPVSVADPHFAAGPGTWGVGDFDGNPGHVTVIANGTEVTHYNYTGSDQYHTI